MWYAIEGTYLFELRFQPDDLPASSDVQYRSRVVDALAALAEDNLLEVYGAKWRGRGERMTVNVAPDQIGARLLDPDEWQEGEPPHLFFLATLDGREAMKERP